MIQPKPPTKTEMKFLKEKVNRDELDNLTDRELWIIEGWLNE